MTTPPDNVPSAEPEPPTSAARQATYAWLSEREWEFEGLEDDVQAFVDEHDLSDDVAARMRAVLLDERTQILAAFEEARRADRPQDGVEFGYELREDNDNVIDALLSEDQRHAFLGFRLRGW